MINIKQNITKEQLEELTKQQLKNLFEYWWFSQKPKAVNPLTPTIHIEHQTGILAEFPLLSIGDMIEFLIYNKDQNFTIERYLQYECVDFEQMVWEVQDYIDTELCDVLWELTKAHLNR